jgi:hypothetical protein
MAAPLTGLVAVYDARAMITRALVRLVTPFALVASLAGCSPAPAPGAATARSTRDQMLGSWELQSRVVRRAGGEVVDDPVLGQQPIGRLFYDGSGHMALQMMRQGRLDAITEPTAPGGATNARVILGYDAYFGTFAVDEQAGTVTHHIEGSLFPEDLGKDFVRRYRLDGDRFELSFTSSSPAGDITRTLVFGRSRAPRSASLQLR